MDQLKDRLTTLQELRFEPETPGIIILAIAPTIAVEKLVLRTRIATHNLITGQWQKPKSK